MKEDNDNKKNNTDESPKSHSDNTQANESGNDNLDEKKALIDFLEERIRAFKIDESNIEDVEEDNDEPETDDMEEY